MMKLKLSFKTALLATSCCLALNLLADDPAVSGVTIKQRWPWSRLVDIDYTLTTDQRADITVRGYKGDTALELPEASFSGGQFGMTDGSHTIVWDPGATSYTNSGLLTDFRVGLSPAVSPLYMIIDLTNAVDTAPNIEYIYPGDARLTTEGRFTDVWFDVTNDTQYMTSKLVLRRVPSGTYKIGGSKDVTLTKEFYIGLFEITQEQWKNVMGSWWSYTTYTNEAYRATRPADMIGYNDLRGATNDNPAIDWPWTVHQVTAGSFVGKLRAQTGIGSFDLPTEAQWEYACRAGTTTYYNDGNPEANANGDNAFTNQWLNALGRYRYNGGMLGGLTDPSRDCTTENGTASVGSYAPNNWGLYDMHGNVYEICLDWYNTITGGIDPEGLPENTTYRVRRGASWAHTPSNCSSSGRSYIAPNSRNNWLGFRVALHLR